MKLQVFENIYDVKDESDLRAHLNYRHNEKYGAFWLCSKNPELALFINDNRAWLYYMPPDEDGMMTSLNPDTNAAEEIEVDFLIENYQLDSVPETMTVNLEQGISAFVHYFIHGQLGSQISWE